MWFAWSFPLVRTSVHREVLSRTIAATSVSPVVLESAATRLLFPEVASRGLGSLHCPAPVRVSPTPSNFPSSPFAELGLCTSLPHGLHSSSCPRTILIPARRDLPFRVPWLPLSLLVYFLTSSCCSLKQGSTFWVLIPCRTSPSPF